MFLRGSKNGMPTFRWQAEEAQDDTDPLACFPAGARILTADGPRAAGSLRPGDRVWCQGDSHSPVLAVETRVLRPEPLADPRLWPVRVAADALGAGVPERPLLLSPAQRICLGGWRAEGQAAPAEVLVPVLALVNGSTIAQRPPEGPVPAVRFLLDESEIVQVEGLLSEAARRRRLFGIDPVSPRRIWPDRVDRGARRD